MKTMPTQEVKRLNYELTFPPPSSSPSPSLCVCVTGVFYKV